LNQELITRVAARTMRWPFRMWNFGEAIALRGLLAAYEATGDREPLGYVKALLRSYIGRGVAKGFDEHVAPGAELLQLYQLTGEEEFLCAARQLAAFFASLPKNVEGARMHRPDLPGWCRQIWVDCMDVEPPFLAVLSSVTGEPVYREWAVQEICEYARLLQDPETGLFYHGYEEGCGHNGQLWARGNGWALMGLVETLKLLPRDHDRYAELLARFKTLASGLARYQRETGFWNVVVPDSSTSVESTLAVMVAYSLRAAFAAGILDETRYGAMERRARAAVMGAINDDGALDLVTEATPVGEWSMYASRPFGVFPWGQGPLLLMLRQI